MLRQLSFVSLWMGGVRCGAVRLGSCDMERRVAFSSVAFRQFSRGWVWLVQLGSGKLGLGKAVYKWCARVMSVWLRYARFRQFVSGEMCYGAKS